jgi:hypothetical protein
MMNLRLGILIFSLSVWFSQSASISAEEIATNSATTNLTIDGVQYENVRWGRVTPATVTIFHKTGVASIPLGKLPPDLQKKFGYDPQKAAEWIKAEAQAEQQRAAAAREAQPQKAASDIQPAPPSVPPSGMRSNLPAGVRFAIMSETGSYEPFAPFEPLKFRLTFDAPDSWQNVQRYGKFSISGRSMINGRLFPKPFVDNLRMQFATEDSKRLSFEWVPVRDLIPPQTGKYNIQVVLDTPTGRWITPMTTVEVSLPETDRASLKFLVEKGGGDFFLREVVLRTRSESHLRQPPYPVIKQFIKTFPDSSLNALVVRQAEHACRLDTSQGPHYYLDQDREQLAEIIALAHPSKVQELEMTKSSYEKRVAATEDRYQKQLDQKEIEGINRWIALLTKYTQ